MWAAKKSWLISHVDGPTGRKPIHQLVGRPEPPRPDGLGFSLLATSLSKAVGSLVPDWVIILSGADLAKSIDVPSEMQRLI